MCGDACSVTVVIIASGHSSQIPDKAVYISHLANTLGKGMNLPPAMSE